MNNLYKYSNYNEQYDIEELREKIILHIETEAMLMYVAAAELSEVDSYDDEEVIEKAKELNII